MASSHTLKHWVGTGDLYGVLRAHRQKPPTDIAPTVQMHAHTFIYHQAVVYRNAWSIKDLQEVGIATADTPQTLPARP